MNELVLKVINKGRTYITPEDIQELIDQGKDITLIRLWALEVLGNHAGVGAEDRALCAWVA